MKKYRVEFDMGGLGRRTSRDFDDGMEALHSCVQLEKRGKNPTLTVRLNKDPDKTEKGQHALDPEY